MFLAIALFLNTAQAPTTTKKQRDMYMVVARVCVRVVCLRVCVQAYFNPRLRNQLSDKLNRRHQQAGAHVRAYVCWWHLLFCFAHLHLDVSVSVWGLLAP